GAHLSTVEAEDAEVFRTDLLHTGVKHAARLAHGRGNAAATGTTTGTGRGHEMSLQKADRAHPIFAAGASEEEFFKTKPTYQGSGSVFLTSGWLRGYDRSMARRMRCADAGYVYHVLNRAVGRLTIFEKATDYAAFEKVLRQAGERSGMRLLAYVVLPNHWHLV